MVQSQAPGDVDEDAFLCAIAEAGQRLLDMVEMGDLTGLKDLVRSEQPPMFYQDPESGWSALHFAAENESPEMLTYLLEEGAVWNAVDKLGNTAADVALSLNSEECYNLIRDAGVRSEFILKALVSRVDEDEVMKVKDDTAAGSTDTYLKSSLRYTSDENGQEVVMVDAGEGQEVGVMMGWELPIMKKTVQQLCAEPPEEGFAVLNIGFGLGMIDGLFQALPQKPELHVIIEAHSDVLAHMRKTGWYEKPGVVVLEGKWQSFIESEQLLEHGGFDVIYTDTFSEDYNDLCQFFEQVPNLLKGPSAKFSWFNGLGATNALFYDVYTRLAELQLDDIGLSVQWSDVEVHGEDETIWSGSRKYFSLPYYRLPICQWAV